MSHYRRLHTGVVTIFAHVRMAALKLLSLPQYGYLRDRFGERRNPLYTRLYYALAAQEGDDINAARKNFEDAGINVRGLIYDGMLV